MISVCMATYNGERFIKEQIDSILVQLDKDDELIISDDGSTDKTLEIIASYKDSRIKVFHHQKNPAFAKIKHSRNFYYATSNFENALKQAQGDYIFLSDQDDVWMPDKVKKMIMMMQENSVDCVLCNNSIIDETGNCINSFNSKTVFQSSVLYNLKITPFLGCCMAIKKESLSYILPFPRKCIGHDLWIGCLCASKRKMSYISESLHKYRVHSNNVSPTISGKSKNNLWFKISYRIEFLFHFYIRILLKR